MSKKKDARTWFPYYAEWAKQLLDIPADLRIKIDDAVKRYVLYGEEPQDREVLYSMFALMRAQIDRDRETYNHKCSQNAENVRKRWNMQNDTTVYDCMRMNTTATNKKYKEKENIQKKHSKECKKEGTKRTAFVPPSLDELRAFVSEHGLTNVDSEEFIDYYASNGWRVGKQPMKDWCAAARNWNRRQGEFGNKTTNTNAETKSRYKAL